MWCYTLRFIQEKNHTNDIILGFTWSFTQRRNHILVCELGPTYIHMASLRKHMRIHTGDKPFIFSQGRNHILVYELGPTHIHMASLRKHMRMHTGEKPFIFSLCEYISIFDMLSHLHWSMYSIQGLRFQTEYLIAYLLLVILVELFFMVKWEIDKFLPQGGAFHDEISTLSSSWPHF